MNRSDAAAVIVNYRTRDLTASAISSVLSEPEIKEVVVVDNASGDASAPFLREAFSDARLQVIESERNRGFGKGVNLGAASTCSPLLLVLNSDATLIRGSVNLLASVLLTEESVGVVAPAVYTRDGVNLQAGAYGRLPRRREVIFGTWSLKSPGGRARDDAAPEWVSGVAMMLRRNDFDAVGGFDESFDMYFEDLDLCRRLRERGKVVRRHPGAGVVHLGGGSWQSSADQVRSFHEAKRVYFAKLGATTLELHCVRLLGGLRTALARWPGRNGPPLARQPSRGG